MQINNYRCQGTKVLLPDVFYFRQRSNASEFSVISVNPCRAKYVLSVNSSRNCSHTIISKAYTLLCVNMHKISTLMFNTYKSMTGQCSAHQTETMMVTVDTTARANGRLVGGSTTVGTVSSLDRITTTRRFGTGASRGMSGNTSS